MSKFIFYWFLLFTISGTAQSNLIQQNMALESLVPPGPNAAELGKYGTYPVGTMTGIPEISFPMYEINTGKLKLPITLSYHASGIQVNQRSTDVGLGWSVMAGGQITRTVYGSPDEYQYGYFNYTPPTLSALQAITNYYTMGQYNGLGYDLEPDLFVYNFAGKSGEFVCNANKGFTTIPFEPISIQKTNVGANGQGNTINFTITDDDGVIYQYSLFSTRIGIRVTNPIAETWYLTSITSPDLTDVIQISYTTYSATDFLEQDDYPVGCIMTDVNGVGLANWSNGSGGTGMVNKKISTINHQEYVVSQITFRNGSIVFNRNTARQDVLPNGSTNNSLDQILVKNSNGSTIKKITFNHNYFVASPASGTSNDYRLQLTGYAESDSAGLINKQTNFGYDPTPLPPYGSYSIDYWGFSNGASTAGVTNLIPAISVSANTLINSPAGSYANFNASNLPNSTIYNIGSANRAPSATYMTSGMLEKVTYPTGGYTQFTYEPHQYTSDFFSTQEGTAGGTTYSPGSKFSTVKNINTYSFSYPSNTAFSSINTGTTATLSINFSVSNVTNGSQTVTLTDITGNTVQTWTHPGDPTVAASITAYITLYSGHSYQMTNSVGGALTTYFVTSNISWLENIDTHPVSIGSGLRIKTVQNYGSDGTLANEEDYTYGPSENGIGTKLFDETVFRQNYNDIFSEYYEPIIIGSSGIGNCYLQGDYWQRDYMGISRYNCINYMGSPILYPSVTKYEGTASVNMGKTVWTYNIFTPNQSIPTMFENSGNYGTLNLAWKYGELVDETKFKNTGSQYTPVTETQYGYTDFNQANLSGIQVKQYKQFVQLQNCACYSYGPNTGTTSQMGDGFFAAYQYSIPTGASRLTTKTSIVYDQQNPAASLSTVENIQYQNNANLYPTQTSTTRSDGTNNFDIINMKYPQDMSDPVSALMVTKNILNPVVQQQKSVSIAGTSTLLSTTLTNYQQIGNLIEKQNVQFSTYSNPLETRLQYNQYDAYGNIEDEQKANDAHVVYLWSYNGMYPVVKIVGSNYGAVYGIIAQSTIDANVGNDANMRKVLNALRSLPNALVTTYTYAPLIGMTSETDPKGMTTYYEYDALGRLIDAKDKDGNVLKVYNYNYQN